MSKYFGVDYLGGARYGKAIIKAHPAGFAAGFFTNVDGFGDSLPVVRDLLDTGRCPSERLHLKWDDDHQYADKFKSIRKEARRVAKVIDEYKDIEWYVSGACEHRLTKNQATELSRIVLDEMPSGVTYVNSAEKGAFIDPADNIINETHLDGGRMPKGRYIFSYDGQPATDYRSATCQEIKDKHKNAEIFFVWDARCNNNWEWGVKKPRPERKGMADAPFLQSLAALAMEMGSCKLEKSTLWKSHSENKGNGDSRAEKPVFITPREVKEITLFAGGKKVITMPYYDVYRQENDPRIWYRYYAHEWGYKLAMKAVQLSGSPVCEIRVGKKVIGQCNPAFRFGSL